ncbi:hemicentin-1 [Plakobranchus ocellatus]|uniref:Hemicentin-1 n=1 Tax=Plakobranchus ocellatus TaxID=259542 RepID=A0AAV4AK32_9GAST|nr:hemicentin-1 [Plakobranchus ocellatus]
MQSNQTTLDGANTTQDSPTPTNATNTTQDSALPTNATGVVVMERSRLTFDGANTTQYDPSPTGAFIMHGNQTTFDRANTTQDSPTPTNATSVTTMQSNQTTFDGANTTQDSPTPTNATNTTQDSALLTNATGIVVMERSRPTFDGANTTQDRSTSPNTTVSLQGNQTIFYSPSPTASAASMQHNGTYNDSVTPTSYSISATATSTPSQQSTAELKITNLFAEPPSIHGENRTFVSRLQGSDLILRCNAFGSPPITYKWIRLVGDQGIEYGNRPVLVLSKLRIQDAGQYICVARNRAGVAHRAFDVTVKEPPTVYGENPLFVSKVQGSDLTLRCNVFGSQPIIYKWIGPAGGQGIERGNGSELVLTNLRDEDAGQYICEARNVAGMVRRVFHVIMEGPPFIYGENPLIVSSVQGSDLVLSCNAFGSIPITYKWIRPAGGQGIERANGSELVLTNLRDEDAGQYICEATDKGGMVQRVFDVIVQGI